MYSEAKSKAVKSYLEARAAATGWSKGESRQNIMDWKVKKSRTEIPLSEYMRNTDNKVSWPMTSLFASFYTNTKIVEAKTAQ